MKKIIYILSILFIIPLLLCAKEYNLTAANSAYQEQNYQIAKEEYMKLVNEDVENYELFYTRTHNIEVIKADIRYHTNIRSYYFMLCHPLIFRHNSHAFEHKDF